MLMYIKKTYIHTIIESKVVQTYKFLFHEIHLSTKLLLPKSHKFWGNENKNAPDVISITDLLSLLQEDSHTS